MGKVRAEVIHDSRRLLLSRPANERGQTLSCQPSSAGSRLRPPKSAPLVRAAQPEGRQSPGRKVHSNLAVFNLFQRCTVVQSVVQHHDYSHRIGSKGQVERRCRPPFHVRPHASTRAGDAPGSQVLCHCQNKNVCGGRTDHQSTSRLRGLIGKAQAQRIALPPEYCVCRKHPQSHPPADNGDPRSDPIPVQPSKVHSMIFQHRGFGVIVLWSAAKSQPQGRGYVGHSAGAPHPNGSYASRPCPVGSTAGVHVGIGAPLPVAAGECEGMGTYGRGV